VSPRVAIRVDASTVLGTGHLMRCLVLARGLRSRGCQVTLISREHPGHLADWVETSQGFPVVRLPGGAAAEGASPEEGGLGVSEAEDAEATLAWLEATGGGDWLIVDHYGLSRIWEERVRTRVPRILAIDDLANRSHSVDVLLDPNVHPDPIARYRDLVSSRTRLLLGPRYVPLRPAFRRRARDLRRKHGSGTRILVYFGGTDRGGVLQTSLQALAGLRWPAQDVLVLVGATDPRRDALLAMAQAHGYRAHLGLGQDMARLMARADLALGACGSTQWERCVMGLPSLVVTLALNQEATARTLDAMGVVRLVGSIDTLHGPDLMAQLRFLREHPAERRRMAARGRALVDGLGAERILQVLLEESQGYKGRSVRA
jgi:UDP-2,4-diacetamido-2,4,6-trideoxy-beta-L-altropyranose hydrolase